MKPYYNPETKETYRKFVCDDFTLKMITGSVSIEGKHTVWRNEIGQETKREKNKHYVCLGVDHCFECGREMK